MFVVFEGIDGSGKTTLSGRVAAELQEVGVSTHHARPKGELKSRLASNIRTLARDPRNLTMSPHTELFLYIARDSQMIDTVIRPSINAAEVVIADRYLFSPMVLCRARGIVSPDEVDRAVSVAAQDLWPDLVVYCDVDIDTSYLRKRLDKIEKPKDPDDFGRKGLRGLGLRSAMRREYLALAAADPKRWFTVDNANGSIEENTGAIVDRILSALGRPTRERAKEDFPKPIKMTPGTRSSDKGREVRKAFYDYASKLISNGMGRAAAYHLRSLDSEEAWELRESLIPVAPELVIYGLAPLSSPRAIEMRRRLIDKVPTRVARSLGGIWADDDDEAWQMREHLEESAPIEVALTLGTLDSPRAWSMRDKLAEKAPAAVLSSLKSLDSTRAWEMRGKFGKKNKWVWGLLEGLAHLEGERAWEIRHENKKKALPWVILSTLGCNGDEAWNIRRAYLEQATKLVLRSLAGSTEPEAWEMRKKSGPWAKETLTTIKNIDTSEAWELRRELKNIWPVFAAKSVGLTLAGTDRGSEFLWELAEEQPNNPEVIHYVVKALEAYPK
ncbi:MAG: dTMP kinase [Proteobacteria bacterium]|nr:dTMP kinase [Pseudomonadota bacterium]